MVLIMVLISFLNIPEPASGVSVAVALLYMLGTAQLLESPFISQ